MNARLAPRHESVQVGAADQRESGPQRDRGDDVRAGHDAGVDMDLVGVADLADDLRKQVEGYRGPVQLAAAVVGQHDAVDPDVGDPAGLPDTLDAFDDDLSGPLVPDPGKIINTRRRV